MNALVLCLADWCPLLANASCEQASYYIYMSHIAKNSTTHHQYTINIIQHKMDFLN